MKIKNKKTGRLKFRIMCTGIKAILSGLLFVCFCMQKSNAQTIPSGFFGINHWMPAQIPITSSNGFPGGFVNHSPIQTQVKDAGAIFYRIGGNDYDEKGTAIGTTTATNDYLTAIAAIKAVNSNAKFLIQIPFESELISAGNMTVQDARDLVNRINDVYTTDVFYYQIGNEWDDDDYINTDPDPDRKFTSSEIATRIKDYATAMKAEDNTIKIVAPAVSHFWAKDVNNQSILENLLGATNDITMVVPFQSYYYVDVISFHSYPEGNDGDMSATESGSNYSTYRTDAIAAPNGSFTTGALGTPSTANTLQDLLDAANDRHSRTGANALTYAITEMNICWQNPDLTGTGGSELFNTTYGLGVRSFFAGQFWLDMFSAILKNGTNTAADYSKVAFVMPWGIHQSGGDGDPDDLGMTKGTASASVAPTPLPVYWHYQLMANNFPSGATYFPNVSTAAGQTNYKAFACTTATEIRVIIMNQTEQTSPRGSDNSTNSVKINFNYTGTNPSGADMLFAFATGNTAIGTSGTYTCNMQKETSVYLVFTKSTGVLSPAKSYSLQDALRPNDIGPMLWVGGTSTINTDPLYESHVSNNVYSVISITPNTGNPISANNDKVFQFSTSAEISCSGTGTFSSNGKTLLITYSGPTTCH